jgi:hypothetical protein
MASSPRGQHELDFEAEEAAILSAVGESRIDLGAARLEGLADLQS